MARRSLSLSSLALGVLAGIGGFTDTGGVVTATAAGAKYGFGLAWTVVFGFVGFAVYAEMSGRIAISSSQASWDLIRLRLGRRLAVLPLVSTLVVHLLTLVVDVVGMSLAVQLATGVSYLWLVPIATVLLAAALWFVGFSKVDTGAALIGLVMLVAIAIALALGPHWHSLGGQLLHPTAASGKGLGLGYLFAVASMLGAFMTPYQFDFYSSGALEENWQGSDIATNRIISLIGPAVGGLVTLGLLVGGADALHASHPSVNSIQATVQPAIAAFGHAGLALFLLGLFAVSLAASVELCLSGAYAVCQYFGWDWGESGAPRQSPMFHLAYLTMLGLALAIAITGLDPIRFTTITMAFGAAALPFSFGPLLLVANDPQYMGVQKNGLATNVVAVVVLAVLTFIAIATVPLLVLTGGSF